MNILVTYDVSTKDKPGQKRLRRMAKLCEGFGQRVQLSVFECEIRDTEYERLKAEALKIMDPKQDRVRFYRLVGNRDDFLEEYGTFRAIDFSEPLVY